MKQYQRILQFKFLIINYLKSNKDAMHVAVNNALFAIQMSFFITYSLILSNNLFKNR